MRRTAAIRADWEAMTTFTAIDFETANGSRASACSIAAVRMDEDGRIIDTRADLIRPPEGLDYFHPMNVSIHGIHPADVVSAPAWEQIVEDYRQMIGDGPVVAHNMAFDFSVWNALAAELGTPTLDFPRLCTYRIAQGVLGWPRGTMKLDQVFRHYFPSESFAHHQADADALACARILVAELGDADVSLDWLIDHKALTGAPTRRRRPAPYA